MVVVVVVVLLIWYWFCDGGCVMMVLVVLVVVVRGVIRVGERRGCILLGMRKELSKSDEGLYEL